MRLWSLHPSYLDSKGLVALWREGLLALHVLSGKTKGYTNHPQLLRFKSHSDPVLAITAYLHTVADEAEKRGYSFQRNKLDSLKTVSQIPVTLGQLTYEIEHLRQKLATRDPKKLSIHNDTKHFISHPLFKVIDGTVENWEKISK
jgi:hypothetical protein